MISENSIQSAATLETVRELYEGGLYIQAYRASLILGELGTWQDTESQILGGRLAGNIGAPRLGQKLHGLAYRANRRNAEAAYYWGCRLWSTTGIFRVWQFLSALPEFPEASLAQRADLLSFKARILSIFRDFQRAEGLIEEAIALTPERAWIWCEKAEILRARDEREAAYESVAQALKLQPFYRPAVQVAGSLLQALNRDDEALSLLAEGCNHTESGAIACQLALLQTEVGNHAGALKSWLLARDRHPLAEEAIVKWLHSCVADAYYHTDQYELAAEEAELAGGEFYSSFAERLRGGSLNARIILPVEFVAQSHMTCAPATMSALSRYWMVPINHEELVAEICYEGTSDHIERHWAESHGFLAREFRLTWEIACQLIDRGIPFSLATVETTSAHLQAVIGYDRVRETFILRDPSHRVYGEVEAGTFLKRYEAFGPRCMLMIPWAEESRLEGVVLAEAEIYDLYYQYQRRIETHDRPAAMEMVERLRAEHPGHRLTLWARRWLANYDSNPSHELDAINGLLELYPTNGNLLWGKSHVLGRLAGGQEEHRTFLREIATGASKEPVFWREWARELGKDGRRLDEAQRYLKLALRAQPCEADNLAELANSLWDERDCELATELYRLAAGLPGGGERFGRSYFLAARYVRKTDEALAFLRRSFETSGQLSVQPARVLFFALSALERLTEAFDLLDEALRLRPKDGELLLFAADEYARHNQRGRAEELLASAEGLTSKTSWLRTVAALAEYRCDHGAALRSWMGVHELEPMAGDALRGIPRLLAETEGRPAALRFLAEQNKRFPYYSPVFELELEWLREEPPVEVEPRIRRAISLTPDSAWTFRELALNLANQQRFEEALEAAGQGLRLEPASTASHGTLAQIYRQAGRLEQSREAYRETLRLSVDYTWAIRGLFATSDTFPKRGEAVIFVQGELIKQVVLGDGISAFREEAYSVLDPAALLVSLREAFALRPDLWQAWMAVVEQLVDMKMLDEALDLASQAAKRFPLLPACWLELAIVRKLRAEWEDEIEALRQALALNPAWSKASRGLAEAYERKGEFVRSYEILEQAVSFSPLDAYNHGTFADMCWRLSKREQAIEEIKKAILLDPDYRWAWVALENWSVEIGQTNLGLAIARELTENRGGEVHSWLRLATALGEQAIDEKLAALDQAESIAPKNTDIHDLRALVLSDAGRFDEAAAACRPVGIYGGEIPFVLLGREAWIPAMRGDLTTATKLMKEVVKQSPDYYWGWERLVEWQAAMGNFTSAVEAARNLARLSPRQAIPLGYLGDLYLRQGKYQEAMATFEKAFKLDPSYEYAGFQLFSNQLRTGDRANARLSLDALKVHHPGPRTEAARISLACALGHKDKAIEILRRLCFVPERATFALREASKAIFEADWAVATEKVFRSLLDDDAANPEIGSLWVEAFSRRRVWFFSERRLRALDASRPVGLSARFAYLDTATAAKKERSVLSLIKRDGEVLRKSERCWAQVGYALTTLHRYRQVVEWMHDWKEKTAIQPWMIFNLVLAQRNIGADHLAREVGLHALELRGDHTTHCHHLFVAWDEAKAGKIEAARARLAIVPSEGLDLYFKVIRALTTALISVLGAKPERRTSEYLTQKIILRQEDWSAQFGDKLIRRMGRESVEVMAKASKAGTYRLGRMWNSVGIGSKPMGGWAWVLIFIVVMNLLRTCSQTN